MNHLVLQSVAADEINLHALHRADLNDEDIFFRLVLTIGIAGKTGSNYFYTTLATPEALLKYGGDYLLVSNRTLVVRYFDLPQLIAHLENIVRSCSRDSWEASCQVLTRYFDWEFEDYRASS